MSAGFNAPYYAGTAGGGILQETLKSSFLFNFRTGNVVVDTIITGLVIYLTTYLMGVISHLSYIDWKEKICRWLGFDKKGWREIVVSSKSGQYVNGCRGAFSPLFNAVLHHIKNLNCDESEIVKLSEIFMPSTSKINGSKKRRAAGYGSGIPYDAMGMPILPKNDTVDDLEEESVKRTNLVVSQHKYFQLAEDVFGRVNVFDEMEQTTGMMNPYEQRSNTNQPTRKVFEITITSSVLSMNDLRSLVQTWVKEYLQFIEPKNELHYFQFHPTDETELRNNRNYGLQDQDSFSEFRFESSKQFENLFFPEKKELIEQLDHFSHNAKWYKEKGLPHTLGFLFHGEPGCGKTSTIKAIANYTKRHIVSISLKKIKSQKELFEIFYDEYINERKIPINKRLYVLEDIDCNTLEDVVGERSCKEGNNSSNHQKVVQTGSGDGKEGVTNINLSFPNPMDQICQQAFGMNPNGQKSFGREKKPDLTLADILETLDGVMEIDGRMLVITTNYPDKLDAALKRPGRIDLQLEFKRCTSEILCQMYEHFCGSYDSENDIWPEKFQKGNLPTDKWTPAEAAQILVRNIRSPLQGLMQLADEHLKQ